MALDLFGVALSGQIEVFASDKSESKLVDLWVDRTGSTLFPELGPLSYVSQIQTNLTLGQNAEISLVLTPPFEEGLKLINSDILHWGIGRLYVTFGYTTGTETGPFSSFTFSGLIQKPDISIGTDITITIHALGVGYQMNITGGTTDVSFSPGLSYAGAIHQTLLKYTKGQSGRTLSDPDSGVGKVASPLEIPTKKEDLYVGFSPEELAGHAGSATVRKFFGPPPVAGTDDISASNAKNVKPGAEKPQGQIVQGPRNDWWFLTETLKDFGLDLFILGTKVFISDQVRWMSGQTKRGSIGRKRFLLRGEIDVERNLYPILTFASATSAVWLSPGVGKYIGKDHRTDKGKKSPATDEEQSAQPVSANAQLGGARRQLAIGQAIETASADKSNVDITRSQKGAYNPESVDLGSDAQDAGRNLPGNPENAYVVAQMQAEWKSMQMTQGIACEISTVGIPNLIPGEVVDVMGFAPLSGLLAGKPIFEGAYGVTEVRHSVGVSGFTTSFRGTSGLFPKAFLNATKGKEGEIQSKPIPESSDSGRTNVEPTKE